MQPSFSQTSYSPDQLVAGHQPALIAYEETLLSGQNLTRGAVVGKVTASGKVKAVDDAQTDGSEVAYGVLVEATDASGGDVQTLVYVAGFFNENALTFGGNDTIAEHRAALRDKGIYTTAAVSA